MLLCKANEERLCNSVLQNIKYSLGVSSISGVGQITNEDGRTKTERILWVLVIILMIGLAIFQGLNVLTRYEERPVIVTVDKSFFDWKLTFPTATVCFRDLRHKTELNRIIKKLATKLNLSEEILTTENEDFIEYLYDLAFKNYFSYEEFNVYASGAKKEYLSPNQYMEVLDQVVWMLESPARKTGSVSISPVNLPFNEKRPVLRIFTEYGPCMTVNPDAGIFFTPEYFNSSASYYGYKTINYTKNVMASFSVKIALRGDSQVFFHSPNEVMDIVDKRKQLRGFYFRHSQYMVHVVTIHDDVKPLTVKQKSCRLPQEPSEMPLDHVPVYSHNLCKFECRIKIAMRFCNCTPYYYRRIAGEPICNMTGMYCLSKYKDMLLYLKSNDTNLCLSCPQNCEVSVFRESVVIREYEFSIGPGIFGMFIVFPDKIYARKLIFSHLDLLVQIGGIFSLFLGCSLLSFVEIGYFLTLRLLFGAGTHNKNSFN